jgi:hypothetical protein
MKVIRKAKGGWSIEVECTGFGNGNNGCGSLLQVKKIWYTGRVLKATRGVAEILAFPLNAKYAKPALT